MSIGIGVIGAGTVGSGVVELLRTRSQALADVVGERLELVRLCARRESVLAPYADAGIRVTPSPEALIDDPTVQVVVELAGGYDAPRGWVERALQAGKPVVTANKAMLAKFGTELFPLAASKGLDLAFEAAVGGAIPVIRSIRDAFVASETQGLACIINGTSNYILSRMTEAGLGFSQALAEAQEHGYAEADPTFDVEGIDAAHKVALLASLCGRRRVDFDRMHVEGITRITAADVAGARELGCVIRLLGLVERHPDGIDARVHPCLVPRRHPLAGVEGAFNAVFVDGSTTGPALLYGKGAGRLPTASAVVADIVDVARRLREKGAPPDLSWFGGEPAELRPLEKAEGRYYLRLRMKDRPGVLGKVAGILGDSGISVASMIQREVDGDDLAEMVLVTHAAREGALQGAVRRIGALEESAAPAVVLRYYERGFAG